MRKNTLKFSDYPVHIDIIMVVSSRGFRLNSKSVLFVGLKCFYEVFITQIIFKNKNNKFFFSLIDEKIDTFKLIEK